MRIAMVSMHTSPADRPGTGDAGGLNVYVLESAKALADAGHEVDLFTRAPGGRSTSRLYPGVTLFALETGAGIVRKHDLHMHVKSFSEQLARSVDGGGNTYDVFHAHYWLSGLASVPVASHFNVPLVQTFHTLAVEKERRMPGSAEATNRHLAERQLSAVADSVVAVSVAESDVVIDDLRVGLDQVWLARPGVDTATFSPVQLDVHDAVRSRLGVAAGQSLAVVVGRVQPLKGHELAVRLLGQLDDLVLVIAGEATPGEQQFVEDLHHIAREIGAHDRLRFVGSLDRPQLADLMATADVVLVPSYTESFGMVALEAAACGTPVIASDVGGIREAVRHGETGVLIAGRDPVRWAAAARQLLDDPLAAGALGQASVEHAGAHSWHRTAHDLELAYVAASERGGL